MALERYVLQRYQVWSRPHPPPALQLPAAYTSSSLIAPNVRFHIHDIKQAQLYMVKLVMRLNRTAADACVDGVGEQNIKLSA